MDDFKAQTFLHNQELYQKMFADQKENIEQELEWIHPEEDDLASIIDAMKKESGS